MKTKDRIKKFCRDYIREFKDTVFQAVLLLICTAILNLIVLNFYRMLWSVFNMTYSGRRYIMLHPEASSVISKMMNNDLVEISINTTFSAFTICLIISAICRLSYLARYLYASQSIIPKILFWGGPLTVFVSWYFNDQIQLAHWSYTIAVTIVPTLCVFTYCFKFTEALLPELGDIFAVIFNGLKRFFLPPSPRERSTNELRDSGIETLRKRVN